MMTFACTSRTGSSRFPTRNSTRSSSRSVSAFVRAISTAWGDRSTPYTRAAPSLAATNESTPLPHPTSITTSPGSISSASARVRLVCVGANTVGSTAISKGPVRPFHSSTPEPVWSAMASIVAARGGTVNLQARGVR